MKVAYVETLGLPKGVRCLQYEEKDVLELLKDPAKVTIIADVLNKYERQKSALVDFRDDLDTHLREVVKFPTKTKKVKVDNKEVEERDEKPQVYLNRFIAAAIKGEVKAPGLTVTGANDEQKEASVYNWLQSIADTMGDTNEKGEAIVTKTDEATKAVTVVNGPRYSYRLDISRPPRQSKPKTPPDYAIEGATKIINNGAASVTKWKEKFAKGFTDANGVAIDPIVHDPFDVAPPKGATAEQVEATKQANIKALAWAIAAKETQVREKTKAQKLAEFN